MAAHERGAALVDDLDHAALDDRRAGRRQRAVQVERLAGVEQGPQLESQLRTIGITRPAIGASANVGAVGNSVEPS